MMKKKLIVGTLGFLLASGLAYGHGDEDHDGGNAAEAVEKTVAATAEAGKKFAAENPTLLANFAGVKSWPVQGGVIVKILIKGGTPLSYSCHQHEIDGIAPIDLPIGPGPVEPDPTLPVEPVEPAPVPWECHLQ